MSMLHSVSSDHTSCKPEKKVSDVMCVKQGQKVPFNMPQVFLPKNFPTNIWSQKNIMSQKIFGPNKYLDPKILSLQKVFGSNKNLDPKKYHHIFVTPPVRIFHNRFSVSRGCSTYNGQMGIHICMDSHALIFRLK